MVNLVAYTRTSHKSLPKVQIKIQWPLTGVPFRERLTLLKSRDLTRMILVFWIGGCLCEVVAYERWSTIFVLFILGQS